MKNENLPYDKRIDLVYDEHVFDIFSRATERSHLDFKKTFHPEIIFDGSSQDDAKIPLKLFIWDESGKQVLGFINGTLCGSAHELFQSGAYSENPSIGFAYSHNHVFRIEELGPKKRPLLHIRFGTDSRIQVLSDFDSIKYKVYVQDETLVLEGTCRADFPN